jgi:hypothetical protein
MEHRTRLAAGLVMLALAGASAGCGATASQPVPGTTQATTTQGPATENPPIHPVAPSYAVTVPGSPLLIEDGANGKTVTVTVGTQVELLLHNSYWNINASSRPDVLVDVGAPTWTVATPTCAPGMGCNPVLAMFRAASPGTAVLSADRTTCGEAYRCPPDQRHFQVTVIVTS